MLKLAMVQVRPGGRRLEPPGTRIASRPVRHLLALIPLLLLATTAAAASPPPTDDASVIDLPSPHAGPLPPTIDLPVGARIAYVEGAGSEAPLVRVVAADGSGDQRVAIGSAPDWQQPPFANGDVLAYECVWRGHESGLDAICLDELGSSWAFLEEAAWPRWSPAGDAMLVERSHRGSARSWVVDLADFAPRTPNDGPGQTTPLNGADGLWSPNGDRILVTDGNRFPALVTMRADGTDARTVGAGEHASWSPDGRQVAFTNWDGSTTMITATSVLSGDQQLLASVSSPILAMRWLPGDGLAVVAERNGSGTGDLYVIELADGSVRSLAAELAVHPDLSPSPDGAWIAFSAESEGGRDVYLASRLGGWRRLTRSGDASMPAWGSFRPAFERGAFIQSMVDRLRVRSRPWVGADSAMYEPLLSQVYVLEVLDGPVAGSGYWWYRVRLADWETLRLRDGRRHGIRSGWVAASDHDGSAWVGRVDVDPGPRRTPLRRGWPDVRRGRVSLSAVPSIGEEGSLTVAATVSGLHPGTSLTLVAKGASIVHWHCGSTPSPAEPDALTPTRGSTRSWADVTVGADGTGGAALRLLPAPAPVDLCLPGSSAIPIAAEVRWEDLRIRDPLHRLLLLPEAVFSRDDG